MWSRPDPFAIVLCTYNGEAHLADQLGTLREQAGVAEIIVADDGSTDGTMDILERHAAEDPRIRIERNSRRLGVTANFERAIRRVRAPWVALSDQDDLWVPDKLARMRAAWDRRCCLMHHASHKFRGRPPATLPSPAGQKRKFAGDDPRRLLYRNSVVGHTVLVRTSVARRLMPFPAAVPHDWWIGVGATMHGAVQYLDEYLVHYRIHANNAYHAAGSRWRRVRSEHWLRLELLRTLAGRMELSADLAGFVRSYYHLLAETQSGTFSWVLWRFYHRHGTLLFGKDARLPLARRLRKGFGATLGAMWRSVPALSDNPQLPARPVATEKLPLLRRTG